jgi:hypothetical protein
MSKTTKPPDPQDAKKAILERWAKEDEKNERKILREAEKQTYFSRGFTSGIVWAALFFVRRQRVDIAQSLMKETAITEEDCRQRRINPLSIEYLVRAGAFEPPPPMDTGLLR